MSNLCYLRAVFCLTYFPALKIEATHCSGKSIILQLTVPWYIQKDKVLRNHRCEKPKSCTLFKKWKVFLIFKKNSPQKPTKTENTWPKESKSFKMQNEFCTRDNLCLVGSMSWQFQCLSQDSVGNFNACRGLCNWNVFCKYSSLQNTGNTPRPVHEYITVTSQWTHVA
jgi:hypothetical protein